MNQTKKESNIKPIDAIDELVKFKDSLDTRSESLLIELVDIAINALKKQVPMLPVQPKECVRYGHGYDYHDYYCPSCGGFLAFEPEGDRLSGQSRCPYCGQIISWDIITEGWDDFNKQRRTIK